MFTQYLSIQSISKTVIQARSNLRQSYIFIDNNEFQNVNLIGAYVSIILLNKISVQWQFLKIIPSMIIPRIRNENFLMHKYFNAFT